MCEWAGVVTVSILHAMACMGARCLPFDGSTSILDFPARCEQDIEVKTP